LIAGLTIGAFGGSELEDHISRGEVIWHAEMCADKQVPQVLWDQCGIIPTNEVAVIARCGTARFFAKAPSYLLVPPMADRIFGPDVADLQLGDELANLLWECHGNELRAEAQRLMGGGLQ
jgi:hypothetical protein